MNLYRKFLTHLSVFSVLCVINVACTKHKDENTSRMEEIFLRCPGGCTMKYDPICAENKKGELMTFSNECLFKMHNCRQPNDIYSKISNELCSGCKTSCSEEYVPICSKNENGNLKEFLNLCEMKKYNCLHPNNQYQEQDLDSCRKQMCGRFLCTNENKPVCGINSKGLYKTFRNNCKLKEYNCYNSNDSYKRYHNGNCCEEVCTQEYNPVCAKNSRNEHRIFLNSCELRRNNCVYKQNVYNITKFENCQQRNEKCPKLKCTNEEDPICGQNQNGIYKNFTNYCQFLSYNCQNQNDVHKKIRDGYCCNEICSKEYNPVCGRNSNGEFRKFVNICNLRKQNCLNIKNQYNETDIGYCEIQTNNCAAISCSNEEKRVCARNSQGNKKTFQNRCQLLVENCFNPKDFYEVINEGNCCNDICPSVYQPVCGLNSNGTYSKFSNLCQLNRINCMNPNNTYKVTNLKNCNSPPKIPLCPRIQCSEKNKEFLCAENDCGVKKNFTNSCFLSGYNCQNPSDAYKKIHDGFC